MPSPPAAACSTSPAAPATCASTSPPPACSPISIDLSLGMLRADRSGAPRVQADVLRLPMADGTVDGVTCGFALRNLVELPAFFAELARVVRPGGRIALLDVGVPRNRLVRLGHGIYFGRIVPRVGGWLSDPAAYRYLPRSVAYLPPSGRDGRAIASRRVRRRDPPGVHARRGPAARRHARRSSRTGLMRAVTRRADDATRALDLNDVARGDGFLFVRDGVGFAGRGVAARVAVDGVPAVLGAIDHVDETGFDGARSGVGPVALGWVPFAPGGAGEARGARRSSSARAPTARAGSPASTTPSRHWRRRRRRWRRPTPTRSSRSRPSSGTSTPSSRPATRRAPGGSSRR